MINEIDASQVLALGQHMAIHKLATNSIDVRFQTNCQYLIGVTVDDDQIEPWLTSLTNPRVDTGGCAVSSAYIHLRFLGELTNGQMINIVHLVDKTPGVDNADTVAQESLDRLQGDN